jgi:hypothetical protein
MDTIKTPETIDQDRRRLFGTAAMGIATAGAASLLPPSQLAAAPAGDSVRPFRVNTPDGRGRGGMVGRKVAVYYAWSRPGEVEAPLEVIENRFTTLFETRRMLYPRFEAFSDPARFDQSIGGFLDHIMKQNFAAFVEQAGAQTGHPVVEIERVADDGARTGLDAALLDAADTLIVIGLDMLRTRQDAGAAEVEVFAGFSRTRTILSSSVPITTSVTCPIYHMTSDWNGK